MEVIYTLDSVEGEPGPNLYWRGRPDEFLKLLLRLHALGTSQGSTVMLKNEENVQLLGISSYTMTSSENGNTLCQVVDGAASTDLEPKLWREFLQGVLSISFFSSFVYQDLPGANLKEEANIIMGSQASELSSLSGAPS